MLRSIGMMVNVNTKQAKCTIFPNFTRHIDNIIHIINQKSYIQWLLEIWKLIIINNVKKLIID